MTRTRLCVATAFAFATFVCLSGASAQTLHFAANLDGLQMVPPNTSPGSGSADATLDSGTGAFSIDAGTGLYQDLLGGATAALLNDASPGFNGPLIFPLTLDTPGATSGSFHGGGMLSPAQIADMIAGNTYIRIASQVFPTGEIRGQLSMIPEPGSIVLLGLGGLGVLAAAWRRRKCAA
jgi:hypothetical protein